MNMTLGMEMECVCVCVCVCVRVHAWVLCRLFCSTQHHCAWPPLREQGRTNLVGISLPTSCRPFQLLIFISALVPEPESHAPNKPLQPKHNLCVPELALPVTSQLSFPPSLINKSLLSYFVFCSLSFGWLPAPSFGKQLVSH